MDCILFILYLVGLNKYYNIRVRITHILVELVGANNKDVDKEYSQYSDEIIEEAFEFYKMNIIELIEDTNVIVSEKRLPLSIQMMNIEIEWEALIKNEKKSHRYILYVMEIIYEKLDGIYLDITDDKFY
jgi:hypothetical protein